MSTIPVAITEQAIRQAAEKTIAETCAKHNVSRDELSSDAISNAYAYAKERLEGQAALESNEYYKLYLAEKEKYDATQVQLNILKTNNATQSGPKVAVTTVEMARGAMGNHDWYLATNDQKLRAIGVDPASVNTDSSCGSFSEKVTIRPQRSISVRRSQGDMPS